MTKPSERGRSYLYLTRVGFFSASAFVAVSPVLPQYVESFGVSYEQLGLFFLAYSSAWAILQLYTGYLADRFGRKRMAMLGSAIYGAFALLSCIAQDLTRLLLLRVLQGVGLGTLGLSMLGLAAGFEEKGISFALFPAANATGGVLGRTGGGILGDTSLREPFLLSALAAGLAGGAVLAIGEAGSGRTEARFFWAVSRLVRNRAFLLICVGGFLAELGYVSFNITHPLGLETSGTPAFADWTGAFGFRSEFHYLPGADRFLRQQDREEETPGGIVGPLGSVLPWAVWSQGTYPAGRTDGPPWRHRRGHLYPGNRPGGGGRGRKSPAYVHGPF